MKLSRTAISSHQTAADVVPPSQDATDVLSDIGIRIEIETDGPIARGSVSGDIDILTAPSLALALSQLANAKSPVVLDMTDVGFVGTSALSILADFAATCRHDHTSWCLAGNRSILHILEATKIDTEISTCTSVDEASIRVRSH